MGMLSIFNLVLIFVLLLLGRVMTKMPWRCLVDFRLGTDDWFAKINLYSCKS